MNAEQIKKAIQEADDLEVLEVKNPGPGWPDIYVRKLSWQEQRNFENESKDREEVENVLPFFLLCVCDENGQRVFTDKEAELLHVKNEQTILSIAEVGAKFNGGHKTEEDRAKNSVSDPADSGGSDSPAT